MDGRIKIRIVTAISAAAAMLVLAGAAVAQTGAQSPEDAARGAALNKRYHLGQYSPGALAGPRPAGVSPVCFAPITKTPTTCADGA